MNAPVVPSKRSTVFLVVLPTYRLPSGPKTRPDGASSPPHPAAVTGNEHVHEFARDTVVAEHATVRERDTQEIAHVQILVGTEYHAAGPEERITRRAAPLRDDRVDERPGSGVITQNAVSRARGGIREVADQERGFARGLAREGRAQPAGCRRMRIRLHPACGEQDADAQRNETASSPIHGSPFPFTVRVDIQMSRLGRPFGADTLPGRLEVKTSLRPSKDRLGCCSKAAELSGAPGFSGVDQDRKSTRLNSSHSQISYAVFCLKKKKN